MKIFKLTYAQNHSGNHLSFHSSRAAAMGFYAKVARQIEPDDEDQIYRPMEVEEIKFTPTKRGFLEFLARHTPATDNG